MVMLSEYKSQYKERFYLHTKFSGEQNQVHGGEICNAIAVSDSNTKYEIYYS